MPLYEYQCEQCGETFEVRQKFSDEPIAIHDKCQGKVHRLISAPALQFKGSGWYITDYAGGKKSESGSSSSSSSHSNGSSSSSSSSESSGSKSESSTSKSTASTTETKST